MMTLEQITKVEDRYGQAGDPSLGEAFEMLRMRWRSGARDRETALRLMFLAWYSCAEPHFLTGIEWDDDNYKLFGEVFESLGGEQCNDPEVCYVAGLMAEISPYCLGQEEHWSHIGKRLSERARKLRPEGFRPEEFMGRGAYGQYFAHMASRLG